MKFQIVFENTGDQIDFVSLNPEILEYYVCHLDQQGINCFSLRNKKWAKQVSQRIDQLHSNLVDINCWITKLIDTPFDTFEGDDYLDQANLNKLHSDWVNSHQMIYDIDAQRQQSNVGELIKQIHDIFPDSQRFVQLGSLVSRLGRSQQYGRINLDTHALESSFDQLDFEIADNDWHEFPNIFDKAALTNDQANFSLTFNHLGRTLYQKFLAFDSDLKHPDENSYNQLLGFVTLQLLPCQTIPLSTEYQQWCKSHSRQPIGNVLNLGNIPDLQTRLTYYRKLIFKNLNNENNFAIHQI